MATHVSQRRSLLAPAAVLVPAAVLLWAVFVGIGHLLTHSLAHSGLVRWDHRVDTSLATHRTATWNTLTHYATFGAETTTVIALGVIAAIVLRLVSHHWRSSVFLAVAVIGEVTIFVCTTLMVDRARPGVPHLDSAPPTSSFPSGHTAASVSLYTSLAIVVIALGARVWLRALLVLLAVAMPIAVAFSRMYRGMHFPTDVMAGALLSLIWVFTVRAVLLRAALVEQEPALKERR
jgi:undecaprenyl-diphosphatase